MQKLHIQKNKIDKMDRYERNHDLLDYMTENIEKIRDNFHEYMDVVKDEYYRDLRKKKIEKIQNVRKQNNKMG